MKFYTCEEIAEILKVNYWTVWRLFKTKKISGVKIGKTIRITEKEFLEFLDRNKNTEGENK